MELEKSHQYDEMSASELVGLISLDIIPGIREAMDAINVQLRTSEKVTAEISELKQVRAGFEELQSVFKEHNAKEQHLLYPLIKAGSGKSIPSEKELRSFFAGIKTEHDQLRALIFQLRTITHQYKSPSSSTPAHKLAFAQLNELEQDFHRLFFIEEQYLFPRIIRNSRS